MRLTPQVVWGLNLSDKDFERSMRLQTYLTHASDVVHEATFLYGYAIRHVINHPEASPLEVYNHVKNLSSERLKRGDTKADITVWFSEIDSGNLAPATRSIGWLKIAFQWAFHFLKEAEGKALTGEYFLQTQRNMLIRGGDTDTNAAIVGGLIGALVGYEQQPPYMIRTIMDFDNINEEGNIVCHQRPEYLIPKYHLARLLVKCYEEAPKSPLSV